MDKWEKKLDEDIKRINQNNKMTTFIIIFAFFISLVSILLLMMFFTSFPVLVFDKKEIINNLRNIFINAFSVSFVSLVKFG